MPETMESEPAISPDELRYRITEYYKSLGEDYSDRLLNIPITDEDIHFFSVFSREGTKRSLLEAEMNNYQYSIPHYDQDRQLVANAIIKLVSPNYLNAPKDISKN